MDIAQLKPIEIEHEVTHPGTGEGTGLFLQIACIHDSRVKSGIRAATDQNLADADEEKSPEKDEQYDNEVAAAYIVGFRFEGEATWNGETPEYSRKIAIEMASNPVIKQQLLNRARKIGDFYKA